METKKMPHESAEQREEALKNKRRVLLKKHRTSRNLESSKQQDALKKVYEEEEFL